MDQDSIRPTSVRLFWGKIDLNPDLVRGFFRGYRVRLLDRDYLVFLGYLVI